MGATASSRRRRIRQEAKASEIPEEATITAADGRDALMRELGNGSTPDLLRLDVKPRKTATLDAMRLAARLEGMITDPVYEGKSMAGLIDLVASGEIGRDSTVLYAHLGGQPAINAYSALFPG